MRGRVGGKGGRRERGRMKGCVIGVMFRIMFCESVFFVNNFFVLLVKGFLRYLYILSRHVYMHTFKDLEEISFNNLFFFFFSLKILVAAEMLIDMR